MDKDTYLKCFREQLSKTLHQLNVSEHNVSIGIGASKSYINNIINNKSGISLDRVFEIADYLDIPPSMLFDFDTPQGTNLSRMQAAFLQLSPEEQLYWIQLLETKVQADKIRSKEINAKKKEDR